MKRERKKLLDSKQIDIIFNSFRKAWLVCCPSIIIICLIFEFLIKQYIYKAYYRQFILDSVLVIGTIIFLVCFIVNEFNELIYLFNNRKYKEIIILIIVSLCVLVISYNMLQDNHAYACYKDLHYVQNNTYCEDVQNLIKVYTETTSGTKGGKTTKLYVLTANLNFEVDSDIVKEKDYESFKVKFYGIKRVKIRYLPNSNTLLYIEPATDY